MKKDIIYDISPFKIFSQRGNAYIVIFPEIPFWLAVTDEGVSALELIEKQNTVTEIAKTLYGKSDEKTEGILLEFFEPLEESQVIYPKGEKLEKVSVTLPKKPNKITFLQTMCCNLRCRHCCVSEMPSNSFQSMSLEDAKLILYRCKDIMYEGKKSVSFLGGEPLCGDRFNELLNYAHDIGFDEIGISTNGILVDEEFAKTAKRNSAKAEAR